MTRLSRCALLFSKILLLGPTVSAAPGLELRDGDRVVIVGGAFVEREIRSSWLELALTLRCPGKKVSFRNLGWSGDNVFGHSRTIFEPLEKGPEVLKLEIAEQRPTVGIICYGLAESFEGQAYLPRFVEGLKAVIGYFQEAGATRIALVSPLRHEDLGPPLPNPAKHNEDLAKYVAAIDAVAKEGGHVFADIFDLQRDSKGPPPALTENGIHPSETGYQALAPRFAELLFGAPALWELRINVKQGAAPEFEADGIRIDSLAATASGFRASVLDSSLPGSERRLRARDLPRGDYKLTIDEVEVARGSAAQWSDGVAIRSGPDFDQVEALRRAIVAKNELFFHRWRPQNVTYLFLFRKHEQGNNAKEVPMFDPLIAEKEAEIQSLKQPKARIYSLQRIEEEEK